MTWEDFISGEASKPYFQKLQSLLAEERKNFVIYPKEEDVLNAYYACSFEDVKVVILGQDPYHQPNQAMGLSFSVPDGFKRPPSLINIFKEMKDDIGINNESGDLRSWASQGVFLLNALLTVREGEPASHKNLGWEQFTDTTIEVLGNRSQPVIFILWGKWAQTKAKLIKEHHLIIESPHPSPLGAYRGFWGSKPFSKANNALISWGKTPIDWRTD